jgi:phosphoglucomutase
MPTSSAADAVAARLGISLYATPTGWKWFGPLLESGMVQLCGEESFGQGGDYIGEKDAIFAALYWLNILGATGMTPGQVMRGLWDEYGRMFYSQYSYEGVDADAAARIVGRMRGADLAGRNGIASLENIFYSDPATGEKSGWEGTQIKTDDGARIFFRLSGTGTSGATMRFYIEKPERDPAKFGMDNREYLSGLSARAVEIFGIREAFGEEPKKTVAI